MTLLSIGASEGWKHRSADIEAAFLNGQEAPSGLYMEQPREGLEGMDPGDLLEIRKGVFGLATSPR
eukprot:3458132-Alexandrium_andersonii.AAC.1